MVTETLCGVELEPCTTAPNASDVGETTTAAGASPVPSSVADALPPAMFCAATVNTPGRSPTAVGLNVTWRLHVAEGASVLPQLFAETA